MTTNHKENRCYNEDGAELLKRPQGTSYTLTRLTTNVSIFRITMFWRLRPGYDYPEVTGVTGQRPYENQKSEFCMKKNVTDAFERLISNARFQHIILSYSTDGLMTTEDIERIMKMYGKPETFHIL